MTPQELEEERRYRITERLGIMCGKDTPAPEQQEIAEREANEAVERMRNEEA